jgi:micrococcal nuclease
MNRRSVLAAMLALAIGPAASETLDGRVIAIDGDTIWHYAPGKRTPEKIRLLDIDTPETRGAKCEAERIAGYRAKARLLELLQARPITIERCDTHGDRCEDRFGRTLARLSTPVGDVGARLMLERLALPYAPGEKAARTATWCK